MSVSPPSVHPRPQAPAQALPAITSTSTSSTPSPPPRRGRGWFRLASAESKPGEVAQPALQSAVVRASAASNHVQEHVLHALSAARRGRGWFRLALSESE